MKLKHLVGIVFVVAAGGFLVCKVLNKKDCCDISSVSGNTSEKSPESKFEENTRQDDVILKNEEKCDETKHRVYANMSARNEQAKQTLSDIHGDMKKSEENINSKKEDIARMMENLKNKLGD